MKYQIDQIDRNDGGSVLLRDGVPCQSPDEAHLYFWNMIKDSEYERKFLCERLSKEIRQKKLVIHISSFVFSFLAAFIIWRYL
jgi:hypothetical protein